MRERAQSYLPDDFARQVVDRARRRASLNRREYVLIAITAALCLVSVAVANWYVGNAIQERNLARWGMVQAQIKALRTSI